MAQMTCDQCPADAVVVLPGSAEMRDMFLLQRGEPTHIFCLACAIRAGCFIYPSEKPKRARTAA